MSTLAHLVRKVPTAATAASALGNHANTLHAQCTFWTSFAGRPLTKFEQMVIARPFRYNPDQDSWSRVIKPTAAGYPQGYFEVRLEFDLIKGMPFSGVPDLLQPKVYSVPHLHGSDKFHSALPDHILKAVRLSLRDDALTTLYASLFQAIDWDEWRNHAGPDRVGVPLAMLTQKHSGFDSTQDFDQR